MPEDFFDMPKLLDRYIFCEWLKFFAIAIGVTLGILVLHDMYSNLGRLLEWGAGTGEILLYYGLVIPTLVPVVLPISLLLSLIYVLGSMHRNNEITAMRAAGMNVFRITRALWFAGAALAGLLLWLNASAIPYATERSRSLFDSIHRDFEMKGASPAEVGKIVNLCFNDRRDGRLWFTNSFSTLTNKANGVRISLINENGDEVSSVKAREGVFDDVDNCWFFTDGVETTYDPATGKALKTVSFDKKYYRDFKENPKIMALSMRRPEDLSLFEAATLIDAIGDRGSAEAQPYLVRWYSVWASAFACVIVVAIAIPISIAGVRTNPMVGVSKTVGLFFLYFVVDSVFGALGGRGYVAPFWAAAIPVVGMLAFALSLYRKAI